MKPKAINKIEFCYEQIETPDAQQKLDSIYYFIFGETIRLLELDNSKELSDTDNNLRLNGDENAKQRIRIPDGSPSIGKTAGTLANRS